MENLSIDQLADLKIAIKRNEKILIGAEARVKELEWLNTNFTEANKRLETEIDLQVSRIDEAKAENETLKKEKEWILSQFAVDNEKAYKELRDKEEKTAWETQQNALRLIEIEKREHKLVNKEDSNKALLLEARETEKEAKRETIRWEEKLIEIQAQKKKLEIQKTQIDERNTALKEIEKDLTAKRIQISEKELKTLESIQKNQNLVAELSLKEKTNVRQTERLEKLNALFSELKGFVTEKANITVEELENFIASQDNMIILDDDNFLGVEESKKVLDSIPDEIDWLEETNERQKEDKNAIADMTYNELRAIVKERWIETTPNPKKEELIALLSK